MIAREDLKEYRDEGRTIYQNEHCVYIRPHPALWQWFSNFTISFPKNTISRAYTVIPHGSATLVFSYIDGSLYSGLFGPAINPQEVGDHAVDCDMLVIVEFQPAGLFALTGAGQREMTDRLFLFGEVAPGLNKAMCGIIESSKSVAELITAVEKTLSDSLRAPHRPQEFMEAVDMIIKRSGRVTVKELSSSVFYSERHLNRIFDQLLGVSPKGFSRLVRMNSAIRLMRKTDLSLAEICSAAGYYDQPHFIREFQVICGVTPQVYMRNMSDFYNEIAKF